MTNKTKKRRLKKPVKFGMVLFFILLSVGTLGFLVQIGVIEPSEIIGSFTLDKEVPAQDPSILKYVLNYSEKPISIGTNRWTLYQRYRLDDARFNQYCVIDCANFCEDKELGYNKGYVQSWGKCLCRCQQETVDELLE